MLRKARHQRLLRINRADQRIDVRVGDVAHAGRLGYSIEMPDFWTTSAQCLRMSVSQALDWGCDRLVGA